MDTNGMDGAVSAAGPTTPTNFPLSSSTTPGKNQPFDEKMILQKGLSELCKSHNFCKLMYLD